MIGGRSLRSSFDPHLFTPSKQIGGRLCRSSVVGRRVIAVALLTFLKSDSRPGGQCAPMHTRNLRSAPLRSKCANESRSRLISTPLPLILPDGSVLSSFGFCIRPIPRTLPMPNQLSASNSLPSWCSRSGRALPSTSGFDGRKKINLYFPSIFALAPAEH